MTPDLHFSIVDATALKYAAVPQLAFKLHLEDRGGEPHADIQTVVLRCQIRIEPTKRRYAPQSQAGLRDLFGEPHRWGQTQRSMLWTHAATIVPAFREQTDVDLPVPCSFDFNVAATKYFAALDDGEIPLGFLFSGTIFYHDADDAVRIGQIPWEREASFRLPVAAWREMMDHYHPNSAWIELRRETMARLADFKSRRAAVTWDEALERLLRHDAACEEAAP